MPWWPFGKERRVRCPDGTYRYVYKDAERAFPLIAREWEKKAKAAADTLNQIKLEVGVEMASRIQGLLFQLDKHNASVQQKCCAVYVVYKVDPCGKDVWLEREILSILEQESFLRRLDAIIEHIREAVTSGVSPDSAIVQVDQLVRNLQIPEATLERKAAFERVPEIAWEWAQEPEH